MNKKVMKPKVPLIILIALVMVLSGLWLTANSRAAAETIAYQVIRSDGKFQIRDYPELTAATTTMDGNESNSGFGRLFQFISGKNAADEKIAMTSPVLIGGEKNGRTMSFIMPEKTVKSGVPKPTGATVYLDNLPAARFAVLRFPGGRTNENESLAVAELQSWMKTQNLTAAAEPFFAYYDPPWIPTFLRRNEVMIRMASPGA